MRLITDLFAYCGERAPRWNTISISGYHMREAGSTAAQEIAFTLADGIAYVQAALDAGLDVDDFAPRLSFFFACHMHFFEEIAKFRAARRMWARIMRERFEAKDARSWMLRFHTQTGGATLTAQQPEVNIVRTALEALAAVLSGQAQPAMVVSYCSTGSSHDQYFFRRPERMVAGAVTPPRLDVANEDLIRRFMKGYSEGVAKLFNDPDLSRRAIRRFTRATDPKIVDAVYQYAVDYVEKIPYNTREGIQEVLNQAAARNPKARDAKPEAFYDDRFVKELDSQGFYKQLWK